MDPGLDEAHGLVAGGLVEEALARAERHREDHQAKLVDQVCASSVRPSW